MGPLSDAKRRWAVLSDAIRTQLWPLPTAAVVVAVASGVGLTRLDSGVDGQLPTALTAYLFGGDADAARSVLDSVAGSMITVTSLTFSLTVVTLQLASSQFSPRLLRTFSGDRFVQGTLALFLATFAFALTVLRTVRNGDSGQPDFVPQISVTVAYVLAVASVLALVLFLAHVVREIRVETLVRNVHTQAQATLLRVLPELDRDAPAVAVPVPAAGAVPITARTSGFLTEIDEQRMLAAAVDAGAVVLVERSPGSSLVTGTPFGVCWPLDPVDRLSTDALAGLQDQVSGAVSTDFERTAVQDAGYGLRQLTDVAAKALSPGINDPTTAVHTLGHSAALLCEMAQRDLGPALLRDEQDRVRVVLSRPDLAELLELAVEQPRRYGASDLTVLSRLFWLFRELAWVTELPAHRQAVADQLARLRATVAQQDFDDAERAEMATLGSHVQAALDRRWPPS